MTDVLDFSRASDYSTILVFIVLTRNAQKQYSISRNQQQAAHTIGKESTVLPREVFSPNSIMGKKELVLR